MKVIQKTEHSPIATVYIAENGKGQKFEFVESVQPPFTREQKWVLIISTMFGCPVGCSFCDAGISYDGKLSYEELLFQVDYLIKSRFPDQNVTSEKFKIQFSRMGEPSFNNSVLRLLRDLPRLYDIPGFIPSLSSIAPHGTDRFFSELLEIKKLLYKDTFQLQFSIHSTDPAQRKSLMPVKKWDFMKLANYGKRFFDHGGKKVTLNFALSTESIIDPKVLMKFFDPAIFLIKLTPVNPTFSARKNKINSSSLCMNNQAIQPDIAVSLKEAGYEVIISIGEPEENLIGSNCGQYLQTMLKHEKRHEGSYCYPLQDLAE
jgi:23S rRNA (adenine2503-C2)-methyltransferase